MIETECICITSGRGPAECEWVVAKLLDYLIKELEKNGFSVDVLDVNEGERKHTIKSAILEITGKGLTVFLRHIIGTHQWKGRSAFRPQHKRSNWFVGVHLLVTPENVPGFKKQDVRFETMKASGAGGQHVNKVETAIRATHIPSGIVVTAQNERSQHRNKKIALLRLANKLNEIADLANMSGNRKNWDNHNQLERGNPVRVFEAANFQPVRRKYFKKNLKKR